jgi:hypothetical protein
VKDFRVNVSLENVTESSVLISWTLTHNYSGVHVYYTVRFNETAISNVTSPYLVQNLTDGEIHAVQIISNVRGRDMRVETVISTVQFVRTGKQRHLAYILKILRTLCEDRIYRGVDRIVRFVFKIKF